MRTGKYKFGGKEYLITFSARVQYALEAEGISLEALQESKMPVTQAVKLLSYMIDAGDRYARMNDIENPGVVSFDQLLDGLDLPDMQQIPKALADVIGGQRNVEAEPPKNAGAPS